MAKSPQNPPAIPTRRPDSKAASLALLTLLTGFAFLVMGYHPGFEDDAFYLAAIKRNLNPALFPYDADFFRLQFQATIFDKLIALSVRWTHAPLAWIALLWQLAAIFVILHSCWRISRRCFCEGPAQRAAVTMIAVLLTLPVSGTAISIADQHLHPRTLATAAILAAIVSVIDQRRWLAGVLLAIAFAVHAIMASFGISVCAFLLWSQYNSLPRRRSSMSIAGVILFPLGWIFEAAPDAWRKAAATCTFYYLARWHWYEWLGVFAPLVLLFGFQQFLRGRRVGGDCPTLLPLVSSLLYYGVFQTIVGLVVDLPPSLERLRRFEPMRYLQLLYVFFFLIAGGLLGHYVLGRRLYRWALLFVPLSAGMFYAQRQMYPATAHLELPGAESENAWLQAFAWVRQNTPVDSLFALDPHYVQLPGEDYHGFRALAERSVLADYGKDGGMAARVPFLAPRWLKEMTAQSGWQNFQAADFQRLKNEFGVNWVILSGPGVSGSHTQNEVAGMVCPYRNRQLRVCRLY